MADTLDLMQVGNEIRLRLNLISSWNTGTTKGNISPGLEEILNDLTFINLIQDHKLQDNRLIRPVTDDALEFSMPFKYVNNPAIPHPLYNVFTLSPTIPRAGRHSPGGRGTLKSIGVRGI